MVHVSRRPLKRALPQRRDFGTQMTEHLTDIAQTIARDGFAFVRAPVMQAMLQQAGLRDWDGFARSWDDLGVDAYMADGGRYRRRRFAVFRATEQGIARKPHQPHYQSRDYNPLNGDIERWFKPVTDLIAAHPAMAAILDSCHRLFDRLTPPQVRPPSWHIEIHQFRIEAKPGTEGRPTPEGMHRDGVDWVLVLLVNRVNIASGETTIGHPGRRPLGSFTLTDPFDAAVTDDNRVYHGVTAVTALNPRWPSHRDVLVVTFRRE